jgi:hypothetical protein
MTTEPAGLESSVENAEHVCQEVQDLLEKARSTLDRVRDIFALESTSTTMAGILEALSVKEDGKELAGNHWLRVRLLYVDDARGRMRLRQGHEHLPEGQGQA